MSLSSVTKKNDAESVVICSSLAPAAMDVGLEVFDRDGTPANAIATGNGPLLGVAPGATVTLATGATALFHEDGLLTLDPPVTTLANGSGRIVTTSPLIACAGFVVDSVHAIADPAVCPACKAPQMANLGVVSPCTGACTPCVKGNADGDVANTMCTLFDLLAAIDDVLRRSVLHRTSTRERKC